MRPALGLALVLLAVGGATPAAAATRDARPATVPALRAWTPGPGTFALRRDARVVAAGARPQALAGETRVLAQALTALTGRRVRAGVGQRVRPGDVRLALGARDLGLGAEGYRLRVGRAFTVAARRTPGAFYGGRTLLQLVRAGRPIRRGRARDWPRYRERGMMIDCGRAFFSRRFLEARIRELAGLKLNGLHLHLSDDQGFRVQSRSHPEVPTAPFLTRRDVRRLVAVAARHHVELVPEIDAPGHMRAALARHPELQLVDAAGRRQPDKLDVTSAAARRFLGELVDEYAALFPGRWWHTGADEYLGFGAGPAAFADYPQLQAYARRHHGPRANGKDAVLDFVNAVGRRVRARGKGLRVWSDGVAGGSAVRLDRRTSVQWWESGHSPSPGALTAQGHRVLNAGWWPLYYVTGGPLRTRRAPVAAMYERWSPWTFDGPTARRFDDLAAPPTARLRRRDPRQLGASLAVWNDDPAAPGAREGAVAAGVAPRLRVLAQKTWDSPPLSASYAAWVRRTARASGLARSVP